MVARRHPPRAHEAQRAGTRRGASDGLGELGLTKLRRRVERDELSEGGDAGVSAAGAREAQLALAVEQRPQGLLQAALHCGQGRGLLPSKA